jgi:hypothetical protein
MPGLVPEATGQPGGTGMADPFGMINSLMDFQNKANQNRQFQAHFMANQALGEIVAHAPSLEEGAQQAMANPLIAGFGQEGLASLRNYIMMGAQTKQIGQATAGMKMTQGRDAFQNVATAGLQAADDPQNWNKYYDAAMSGVDPSVMDFVKPRVDALKAGIAAKIQGLNLSDPAQAAQARKLIQSSVAGGYIGANGDASRLPSVLPGVEVGADNVPTYRPSTIGAGRGEVPYTLPTGQAAPPAQSAAPQVITNSATKQPLNATPDITPWVEIDPRTKQPVMDTHGNMKIKPSEIAEDQDLKKDQGGPAVERYNMAGQLISSTTQADEAAIGLAKKGGFTVTGFAGGARGAISNLVESLQNMTGKKLVDDPSLPLANAYVQTINKIQHTETFQMKNMLESTGGRGLGVLMQAQGAVPGMENTPLAFLMLNASIRGLANWETGKYEFRNAWQKNPAGTLLGADEAYMRQSPPIDSAKRELAKFGMSLQGGELVFNSKPELDNAAHEGLLGDGDAGKKLYKQFLAKLPPAPLPQ